MLPIHIFNGLERYVLVRAGTKLGPGDERVAPARARRLLETALRRRDPQLIRTLSAVFHMRGEDPEDVASRALARMNATGAIGGDLMLVRVPVGEIQRPVREEEPEAPPPPEQEAPPPEEEEEEEPEARTTIRVSLYFDGTSNNRVNSRARDAKLAKAKKETVDDETNVSRLEALATGAKDFEHAYSIYIEGIGTRDGWWDSTYGKATGMGARGVLGKVKRGVDELLKSIGELPIEGGTIIERLHLDAFGFSRGAAAARNFVHHVLNGDKPLKPRVEALGHPVEEFEINFVGLFDTVASYGIDHTNDSEELHLDAIKVAKKVVHLVAAEEHRENFSLTDIGSATAAGVGVEIYLPGVHSDVGGGYPKKSSEEKLQILDFDQFSNDALVKRFERERQRLLDTGWYREDEILDVNFWNELRVNREEIPSDYSRIPLKHMADFASLEGLTFDSAAERFKIPADLAWARDTVAAHVAAHLAGTKSTAKHWIDMRDDEYKKLRHDYLHFSARYGPIGMAPQFSTGGAMHGKRERVVHPDVTPPPKVKE